MRQLDGLWSRLISFENLLLAFGKARRGKGKRREVQAFRFNVEPELFQLQRELAAGNYQPGAYRLFTIYDRKPRVIAAAPFRDRVVHHALMNVIEPSLDRQFISDSYACRRGKGVHAAVDRYQQWACTYRYVLKMDVQRYFPSMDHQLLKAKLEQRIKDERVLHLLYCLIDGAPPSVDANRYFPGDTLFTPMERRTGIPIGNLTSQFFANLFLDDVDHYVKQTLRVRPYLRYVDDMVVLDHEKSRLADIRAAVRERLIVERLWLHPHKAHITRTVDGLNVFGYLVTPRRRRLRNDNGHCFARKLRHMMKRVHAGHLAWDDAQASIHSWIGHARHAETDGLRRMIFSQAGLTRGVGQGTGCVWSGVGPGTTNRRTCVHRTGTGTPQTTGTTTWDSVSLRPPARHEAVSRADVSMDPSGVIAGVHEPASRPPGLPRNAK
jgi:retron-type reverse transcriptase